MWGSSRPVKQDPLSYLAACSFFRAPKLATLTSSSATPAFTLNRRKLNGGSGRQCFDFILTSCPCPSRDLAVLSLLRHPALPLSGKDLRVSGVFHIGPHTSARHAARSMMSEIDRQLFSVFRRSTQKKVASVDLFNQFAIDPLQCHCWEKGDSCMRACTISESNFSATTVSATWEKSLTKQKTMSPILGTPCLLLSIDHATPLLDHRRTLSRYPVQICDGGREALHLAGVFSTSGSSSDSSLSDHLTLARAAKSTSAVATARDCNVPSYPTFLRLLFRTSAMRLATRQHSLGGR